jgi:hypothetical protein
MEQADLNRGCKSGIRAINSAWADISLRTIWNSGWMKKRTVAATVAVLIVIVVASVFSTNLTDLRVRWIPAWYRQVPDHVNVPVYCAQGSYLSDHHCVLTCPRGFAPGHWFSVSPPASFSGSPCMTSDGRPVSIYDLAGMQVSSDGGTTLYSVISDVPLAKILVTDPGNRGYWSLQVSPLVLSALPTLESIPAVRTEIATIGDQMATFKILRINVASVTGNHSEIYPLGWCCTTITIHVGDDVGVSCEGFSEKVTLIDFPNQTVEFTVQTIPHIGGCPICLSGDTTIDTPLGQVNVKDLTVGMVVWTVDKQGERVPAPIIRVGMTRVPLTHLMVHLILDDGRLLYASPGHPTTDGRTLGELNAGDPLDGSHVIIAQLVPYNQSYTYDILPAGDTGFYWANEILIASTLK